MRQKVSLGFDGLNLNPIEVAPDVWYYEELGGIHVYFQPASKSPRLICVIPWRKLKSSLARKEKGGKR